MVNRLDKILGPVQSGSTGRAIASPENSEKLNIFDSLGPTDRPVENEDSYLTGFLKTAAFEGTLGLFGVDPPESVAKFEAENPGAALGASVVGSLPFYAIPFVGQGKLGLQLASKLPALSRLVKYGQVTQRTNPFLQGAAIETARFAPIESARVLGSAAVSAAEGDPSALTETAFESGANIALIGVLGGGVRALTRGLGGAARPSRGNQQRIAEELPALHTDEGLPAATFDLDGSVQDKLGFLLTAKAKTNIMQTLGDDVKGLIDDEILALRGEVLGQKPAAGRAHVRDLASYGSADSPQQAAAFLNRIFKEPKGRQRTKRFDQLDSLDEMDSELRLAFADDTGEFVSTFEATVQFPRRVAVRSAEASRELRRGFDKNLHQITDNAWIGREADNGLFVVARKYAGQLEVRPRGESGRFLPRETAEDLYAVFKTSTPERFFPALDGSYDQLRESAFKLGRAVMRLDDAPPAAHDVIGVEQFLRVGDPTAALLPSRVAQKVALGAAKFDRDADVDALKKITGYVGEKFKGVIGPAVVQFSKSPRAVALFRGYEAISRRAEARAFGRMLGPTIDRPKQTIGGQVFQGPQREGGLSALIDAATKTDQGLNQLNKALAMDLRPGSQEFDRLIPEVQDFMKSYLDETGKLMGDQTKAARILLGEPENDVTFDLVDQVIDSMNRGEFQQAILNRRGQVVGIGTGPTAKAARKEAEVIVDLGDGLRVGNPSVRKVGEPLEVVLAPEVAQINTIRGQLFDAGSPVVANLKANHVKKNILQAYSKAETDMAISLANMRWAGDLNQLSREFPDLARQLSIRVDAFKGQPGPINTAINKFVDKLAAPVFGADSLTRMTRVANEAMYHWTLGAGDVGFAALNMIQPIQTLMPEIAFVTRALPQELSHYYSMGLVLGKSNVVRPVSFLEPMKIMRNAWTRMRKPDPGLRKAVDRALDEGVVAGKLIEEVYQQSNIDILFGKGGMELLKKSPMEFLRRGSSFLGRKSEEFSRGFAFTAAYDVGENLFKLGGEDLFQFAAEMTKRSMYGYTQADRARIITGGVGGLFGLFKNWTMHYLANLGTYAGAGVGRANWGPLAWTVMGTGSVAGLGGVPLAGTVDRASRFFSDRGLQENLYEAFGYSDRGPVGERTIDTIFYGMPALLGVSLQARAQAPTSDVTRDISQMFSIALWDRAVAFQDFLGDAVDFAGETGGHPATSRALQDKFSRAFLPRTLYRALAFQGQQGMRSLKTGNQLVSDVSVAGRVRQTLGLGDLDISNAFAARSELWKDREEMTKQVSVLGEALTDAYATGDPTEINRIYRLVFLQGIPVDSVVKSYQARLRGRTGQLQQFDRLRELQINRAFGVE